MWTVEFWKATAERVITTFAWTLLSSIGVGYADLGSIPWGPALSSAGVAALLSLLKSVTVNKVTGTGPSLTNSERVSTPADPPGRHERPDA
jgi:hypothetical protein